jgi:hypothetical protein
MLFYRDEQNLASERRVEILRMRSMIICVPRLSSRLDYLRAKIIFTPCYRIQLAPSRRILKSRRCSSSATFGSRFYARCLPNSVAWRPEQPACTASSRRAASEFIGCWRLAMHYLEISHSVRFDFGGELQAI